MINVENNDLKKFGIQESEISRFNNCIQLLKRSSKLNIQTNGDQPKKLLVMKLTDGPIQKEILLHPEQLPIVFGRNAKGIKVNRKRFE